MKKGGRWPIWVICLLGSLYVLTRIGSLSVLPMFLDEAVHIQWAERLFEEGRILRPVAAGRLLAVASYGLALPFDDRLLAARAIAAAVGAATLGFTVLLSTRLFGSRAGVVAGFLYILSPFALVYDRLALSDGFLSASITGLMFSMWRLTHHPADRSARVMVVALTVLSVVSKVSAVLYFVSLPLAFLVLEAGGRAAFRSMAQTLAIGLFFASPMLWFFVLNGGEITAQHVVDPSALSLQLFSTLSDMCEWALRYFTAPALLFALVSVALLRDGRSSWLAGTVVIPFLLFAFFSKPWSARYVLPTLPPLLILISGGLEALAAQVKSSARTPLVLGLSMMVAFPGLFFVRELVFDPSRAPFPSDDRHQLVSGWPAGYGVRELSIRLLQEADAGPLTAFVDTGGTRTIATSLPILLRKAPSLLLVEGDFGSPAFRARMALAATSARVFAILGPRSSDLELMSVLEGAKVFRVAVFERPGGEWAATLFRLVAAPSPAPGPESSDIPSEGATSSF
ncbi:MAG: glycosyltransferase family 39 protein [Vicinamibacteria bacterium]|nr:glycosyltransferase family 39 protein [Vicinamibacteria bacterium]